MNGVRKSGGVIEASYIFSKCRGHFVRQYVVNMKGLILITLLHYW